ncbi:hypothetical protein LVJ94_08940 [Pendulispora rubella]|uniref:Phosphatidylglycerol/phosphatidylinositol transfer protein n=1 Tax=Pendulispora rubella TaxID=2741070 RepID=A0ABZ2LAI0_9BACT
MNTDAPQRPSHASEGYPSGRRPGWVILLALGTLIIGLIAGYFAGRFSLDREWRKPTVRITKEDYEEAARDDADPTPAADSAVMRPMPLRRTRETVQGRIAGDPIAPLVGSIGRNDGEVELHLTVQNRGTCEVSKIEGVAYGFDARNRPTKMNRHGEHYVAFTAPLPGDREPLRLRPEEKLVISEKLRYVDDASLALAEVTRVTCADGSIWKKP